MNKKILIGVLIVIVLIIGVIVYMSTNKTETTDTDGTSKTAQEEIESYAFNYNGKEIKLGAEFSREEFGQELGYSEVPSCAFEGVDKTYTYEDYEITTYQDGDKEKIRTIYLLNENAQTEEGVKITDSLDDLKSKYKEEPTISDNKYTYTKGDTSIEFIVENEIITSIEYVLNVE